MDAQLTLFQAAETLHQRIDEHGALSSLGGQIGAPRDSIGTASPPEVVHVPWVGEQPGWLHEAAREVSASTGIDVLLVEVQHTHAEMMELAAELHGHLPPDQQIRVRTAIEPDRLTLIGFQIPDLSPGAGIDAVPPAWQAVAAAAERFRSELGIEVQVEQTTSDAISRSLAGG